MPKTYLKTKLFCSLFFGNVSEYGHLRAPQQRHCVKSHRVRSYFGPYFPAIGLNAERYGVSLRFQYECGKMRTRKIPNTETFQAVRYNDKLTHFVSMFPCISMFSFSICYRILERIEINTQLTFKVNDRNGRKRYEICSKLTRKTLERASFCCLSC